MINRWFSIVKDQFYFFPNEISFYWMIISWSLACPVARRKTSPSMHFFYYQIACSLFSGFTWRWVFCSVALLATALLKKGRRTGGRLCVYPAEQLTADGCIEWELADIMQRCRVSMSQYVHWYIHFSCRLPCWQFVSAASKWLTRIRRLLPVCQLGLTCD